MPSTLTFPTNRNHQRSLSLSTSLFALSAFLIPVASTIATKLSFLFLWISFSCRTHTTPLSGDFKDL